MVFVTGGTGMLGAHLLFDLVSKGFDVRALYRSEARLALTKKIFSYYSSSPSVLFDQITWVKGDLLDLEGLTLAMQGVDQVYHAAAMISFVADKADEMFYVNQQGTANLVNIALELPNVKFCHFSSISTIGVATEYGVATEETLCKKGGYRTPYSKSKIAAETEVWRAVAEGLDAVILNPSIILGPGDWLANSMKIFSTVDRGMMFYTTGASAYVDVRDVVDVAIKLTNSGITQERYIISSENMSFHSVFTMVAESLGRRSPYVRLPRYAFIALQKLAFIKSVLLGGVPIISTDMVRSAYSTSVYSNEKICKRLMFEFRPISQTINFVSSCYLSDKNNL